MFKKLITVLSLVVLMVLPFGQLANAEAKAKVGNAFPQDKFPYTSMQIQVMPEFDYPENYPTDQPVLLVGNYGTFKNQTGADYSGPITFPLPTKSKFFEIYIVAEFPEGSQSEVKREFNLDKENGLVSWTPSKPIKAGEEYKFVIEYYENPYVVKDAQKEFKYEFKAPADIAALSVSVLSPLNAKGFKTDVPPTNTTQAQYGGTILEYTYKDVKAGDVKAYNASYEKKDNKSTMSSMDTQNPPNDANHGGTGETNNTASTGGFHIDVAGATIIAIAIVLMGFFIYLGLRQKGAAHQGPSRKTYSANPSKPQERVASKNSAANVEEKKILRKMLINGEIDQETYEKRVAKLDK